MHFRIEKAQRAARRWFVSGRSPWLLPVALAAAILAMPVLSTGPSEVYGGLTYAVLESLVIIGAAIGWLLTDRIVATRRATWVVVGLALLVPAIGYVLVAAQTAAAEVILLGAAGGSLVRGRRIRSRDPAVLVTLAAIATWIANDVPNMLFLPMRDLHTYLAAAGSALAGNPAYLQGPLTVRPNGDQNPFIYPPVTLPLFEFLARLPLRLVEFGWLALSVAATLAALWLIGVRGRWLIAFLAWPVFAVGLSVGNVAAFGFLCFALGYRYAAMLVVGGAFKLQSGVPAIWGIRERRYREILLGIAILGLLVIATIPLTGWAAWGEWLRSLGYFEQTMDRFEMRGASLTRYLPTALVVFASLVAIGVALRRGGRNGLARFGLVSIVASPTLYIHGFGPLLPGALSLRPEILWFALAVVPWDVWGVLPISGGWVAMAIVAVALIRARSENLTGPVDLTEEAADLHPSGAGGQVWPVPEPSPDGPNP
jgi:Glycosyltransferase family 87